MCLSNRCRFPANSLQSPYPWDHQRVRNLHRKHFAFHDLPYQNPSRKQNFKHCAAATFNMNFLFPLYVPPSGELRDISISPTIMQDIWLRLLKTDFISVSKRHPVGREWLYHRRTTSCLKFWFQPTMSRRTYSYFHFIAFPPRYLVWMPVCVSFPFPATSSDCCTTRDSLATSSHFLIIPLISLSMCRSS